jgi:hypothetical protein
VDAAITAAVEHEPEPDVAKMAAAMSDDDEPVRAGRRGLHRQRVEVDGVVIAETRHEDVADDPLAEEEGAETTPDWCATCKGFGVVRGVGSKAGQPYKTANGAATATTSVECPTCHGDKVVAA